MRRPLVSERTLRHACKTYPAHKSRVRNCNRYSDEDKAKGLALARLVGLYKAEEILNIPNQTLADWRLGRYINENIESMANHFNEQIGKGLEEILAAALPEALRKVESASFKDLMVGIGITFDKRQLLNNLPTTINEAMSPEDRARRIAELMNRASERKNAEG